MRTVKFKTFVPIGILLTFLQMLWAEGPASQPAAVQIDHPALLKLHWQLACQASTFQDISFFQMVEQLHAMGVHHIELSPGQPLSDDFPGVKIGAEMSDPQLLALQGKLKSVKMDLVSYGPVPLGPDGDSTRQLFTFAKKLKVKNLVVSSTSASLEDIDKLAGEFAVHVAVLAQPGPGESCEMIAKRFDGRSPLLGVCLNVAAILHADLPADECIHKLADRIIEVNLTDIVDRQKDLTAVLTALKEQKFKGIFAVEASDPTDRPAHWIAAVNAFSAATSAVANAP